MDLTYMNLKITDKSTNVPAGICLKSGAGPIPLKYAELNLAIPGSFPSKKTDCTASFTISSMFPLARGTYTKYTKSETVNDRSILITYVYDK